MLDFIFFCIKTLTSWHLQPLYVTIYPSEKMGSPYYIIPENLSVCRKLIQFLGILLLHFFSTFYHFYHQKWAFLIFFIFWSTFLSLFCSTQRNKNICNFNTLNNIEHLIIIRNTFYLILSRLVVRLFLFLIGMFISCGGSHLQKKESKVNINCYSVIYIFKNCSKDKTSINLQNRPRPNSMMKTSLRSVCVLDTNWWVLWIIFLRIFSIRNTKASKKVKYWESRYYAWTFSYFVIIFF